MVRIGLEWDGSFVAWIEARGSTLLRESGTEAEALKGRRTIYPIPNRTFPNHKAPGGNPHQKMDCSFPAVRNLDMGSRASRHKGA